MRLYPLKTGSYVYYLWGASTTKQYAYFKLTLSVSCSGATAFTITQAATNFAYEEVKTSTSNMKVIISSTNLNNWFTISDARCTSQTKTFTLKNSADGDLADPESTALDFANFNKANGVKFQTQNTDQTGTVNNVETKFKIQVTVQDITAISSEITFRKVVCGKYVQVNKNWGTNAVNAKKEDVLEGEASFDKVSISYDGKFSSNDTNCPIASIALYNADLTLYTGTDWTLDTDNKNVDFDHKTRGEGNYTIKIGAKTHDFDGSLG